MSTHYTADDDSEDRYIREDVPGGTLVYEPLLTVLTNDDGETVERQAGKKLAGFEDVHDWGDVRDSLVARGHPVGALYHLPEIDQ